MAVLFPDLPDLIELLRLGRFVLVAIVLYDIGISIHFHGFLPSYKVMQNLPAQAPSQPWCEACREQAGCPCDHGTGRGAESALCREDG